MNPNGDTAEQFVVRPNHAGCAVGFCDNDKRYPDLVYVGSHVKNLTFHKWPVGRSIENLPKYGERK